MSDPITSILKELVSYSEEHQQDFTNEATKRIRQQIGREITEKYAYDIVDDKTLLERVREVCQLEEDK